MKGVFTVLILVLFLSGCIENKPQKAIPGSDQIPPIDKSLAVKPPMGWNSWDCLGWGATEAEVRAAADYMARNLKHLGYEYIVIDMLWYGDAEASDFEAFVHEKIPVKPNYTVDEFGRLLPDPVKFPSSSGGKGFKPLADYIHSLGLKLGLHILRGIPWQAADKNMPVKGTSVGAASIAQPDKGCVWYDGFYGVDMSKPGAQEYYTSQFELFAQWGVDFVKADDIVNIPELEGISKASRSVGRKIVLSVVPDNIPFSILRENAHMARTGADFWDVWQMVKVGFPVAASAVNEAEQGFWPDLDMLPVGKLGLKISYKGPDPRISNFNHQELLSLLTLWYIARMPLMIGGYLPETDDATLELLTNEEALEVNRNSINPRQIKFKNAIIIWTSDIPGSKDKYLAFFNQWESREPVNIKAAFSDLGLDSLGEYSVHDLWEKKDLGVFKNEFSAPVKAHGAGLYRISIK
ncbi:MAG: alpha-galactosidase [Bacteroidales bacterium]|nr:alpha-galactosidase [Bacteroidales bacterium]